jgi:hypothetical protein
VGMNALSMGVGGLLTNSKSSSQVTKEHSAASAHAHVEPIRRKKNKKGEESKSASVVVPCYSPPLRPGPSHFSLVYPIEFI